MNKDNGLEKSNGKADKSSREKDELRLKVRRIAGIVAIIFAVITVILIATESYTNLTENARFVYYIAFAAVALFAGTWVVLTFAFRNSGNRLEADDAKSRGEVWCTQEQIDEIGQIFYRYGKDEITHCPVCGTKIDSAHCKLTASVAVKNELKGVYVSRNYSPQVEQAYEIKLENRTFNDASKCRCPSCEWEMYHGYAENYDGETKLYTKFNRGKLYGKRKAPKLTGSNCGIFE